MLLMSARPARKAQTMTTRPLFRRSGSECLALVPRRWTALALVTLASLPLTACANTGLQGTGGGTLNGPTVFTFTPGTGPINSGNGAGTPTAVVTTDGGSVFFTAPLFATGGDFVVKDAGSATLLQGDFGTLNQLLFNSTSVFASLDVTYTGGSELTAGGFVPGDAGTLGLTLSGVNPGTGTGPQTASEYGVTFDAVHGNILPPGVPEPSTVAPFAVAGLGLLVLTLCARRRRTAA